MATINVLGNSLTGISGTGAFAGTVSPSFTTPDLGTPSALVLTNATGLPVGGGGTGVASLADGGLVIGNGTSAVEVVAAGATTEVLVGGGASTAPVWTAATGTGAPVRGTAPTITTNIITNGVATTGVAPNTYIATAPDTNGNRAGFRVQVAGAGPLGGLAVQQIAGGGYPNSIGRTDIWVQNGAGSITPISAAASGAVTFANTILPSAINFGQDDLDYYDEVIAWTPGATFATAGDLSVVYSNQFGRATVVGNKVTATGFFSTSTFTHSTAASAFQITNLPFASANISLQTFVGSMWLQGVTKASYTNFSCYSPTNTNYLRIVASGSGQNLSNVEAADMPSGGTLNMHLTITYFV